MTRSKRSAQRKTRPELPVRGVAAHLVVIARLLRGLFDPRSVAPMSSAFVWNTNDRRTMHKAPPRQRWSCRTIRLFQIFIVAMRLIVGVTALQMTGIPHVAAEVVCAVRDEEEPSHDDCPNDIDGRECPPGCPSCHCTHVMSALAAMMPPAVLEPLIPMQIAVAPYAALAPPNPEPAALYRPPRALHG